jgi:hypothetical protein
MNQTIMKNTIPTLILAVILLAFSCGPSRDQSAASSTTDVSATNNNAATSSDNQVSSSKNSADDEKPAEPDPTVADWETINKSAYSIQYPDSFRLEMSEKEGSEFFLFSRKTSDSDLFVENINLGTEDVRGHNISLQRYSEISLKNLFTIVPNLKIIQNETIKTDKGDFQKIVITGEQSGLDLKWQQRVFMNRNEAYVLTMTCEETQYDNYVGIGERIMDTFKLK